MNDIRQYINLVESVGNYLDPDDIDDLTFNDENEIGEGKFRTVYNSLEYDDEVIKVEKQHTGEKQNEVEWENWEEIKQHPDLKQWFAPCISISECKLYMTQEKADAGLSPDNFPGGLMIPKLLLFLDPHVDNWGRMSGRLVMCDYGYKPIGSLLDYDEYHELTKVGFVDDEVYLEMV